MIRSYLKIVFSSDPPVEDPARRSGLVLGLALISNENPNFETASNITEQA